MSNRYLIPGKRTRSEIQVLNSRFIASVAPAFTPEEAREFINEVKLEFPDASHHVPAFMIGSGPSVISHCSDAGEPSGTAGRPVLAVLQGSKLGDTVIVVTRYFGGTKLGTGGLVKAYTEAAQTVLSILPRAEKIQTHEVRVTVPYSYFNRLIQIIDQNNGIILNKEFTVDVSLHIQLATESYPGFEEALKELTNGSITSQIINTSETIIPIKTE